mgnify:CR=1 FL=1
MRGRSDHRAVGVVISLLLVVAVLGLLFAPDLLVLWLVLAGLSGGSSLVLALALVGERSPSAAHTGRLSGWLRASGTCWPPRDRLGRAVLFAATGSWNYPLLAVIAVASSSSSCRSWRAATGSPIRPSPMPPRPRREAVR